MTFQVVQHIVVDTNYLEWHTAHAPQDEGKLRFCTMLTRLVEKQ